MIIKCSKCGRDCMLQMTNAYLTVNSDDLTIDLINQGQQVIRYDVICPSDGIVKTISM